MAGLAIHTDHLFVGEQILERLRAQVPGLPVEGVEQLAQVGKEDLRPRSAFVLWHGERYSGVVPRTGTVEVVQTWLVLLHVRHVAAHDQAARNRQAGPLLSQLHRALAGWTPPGAFSPLQRVTGGSPDYTIKSALYPLAFEQKLGL